MATPVQVDPINGGQWAAQYASFTFGPVLDGSNLYALLTDNTGFEMMKSTDGGLTWTAMDSGNAPATGGGSGWFDLASHTFWTCYADLANQLGVAKFNTTTDTWATVATGGPATGLAYGCALRSDSTLFCCYSGSTTSQLSGLSFNTGSSTFGAEFDVGGNITTLPEYTPLVGALNPTFALDSTGDNVYVAFMTLDFSGTPQMNNGVFFQVVSLTNALGNFFVFPGQIGNPQPDPQDMRTANGPFMGPPVDCGGGNIFMGIARVNSATGFNHAAGYISTDTGATWTEITTPNGIDPNVSGSNGFDNAQFAPFTYFDGITLTVVYAQVVNGTTPSGAIRACQTDPNFGVDPNTWTWIATTALKISQIPGSVAGDGFSFPMFNVLAGQQTISTDVFHAFNLTAWFIPIKLVFGGGIKMFGTRVGVTSGGGITGGTK